MSISEPDVRNLLDIRVSEGLESWEAAAAVMYRAHLLNQRGLVSMEGQATMVSIAHSWLSERAADAEKAGVLAQMLAKRLLDSLDPGDISSLERAPLLLKQWRPN